MVEGEFYLAHPVESRELVRQWELDFEKRTGFSLINPLYDVLRPEIIALDKGLTVIRPDCEEVVNSDLTLMRKAKRGLVAIIDGSRSIGTFQEIIYSHQILKKPETYAIVTDGRDKDPWVEYHTDKIFINYKDFEDFLINK